MNTNLGLKKNLSVDEIFHLNLKETVEKSRLSVANEHIQHGSTSCLLHSVAVAYYSYRIAKYLKRVVPFKEAELIRGALLHDYFLYDWHEADSSHKWHGIHHPKKALKNAEEDFELSHLEKDIIKKHMFPLTFSAPSYRESILVCLVDKVCSIYETLGLGKYHFLKIRFQVDNII